MKIMKLTLLVLTFLQVISGLGPATTSCQVGPSCDKCGFTLTNHGCFYVEKDFSKRENWFDSEAVFQGFGSHVHLATLDTEQLGTLMLHWQNHPCGSMILLVWIIIVMCIWLCWIPSRQVYSCYIKVEQLM